MWLDNFFKYAGLVKQDSGQEQSNFETSHSEGSRRVQIHTCIEMCFEHLSSPRSWWKAMGLGCVEIVRQPSAVVWVGHG